MTTSDDRAGYRTVDLDQHRNAGSELINPGATPALGARIYRGLPFAIGDDPARCFIGLGEGLAADVAVKVDSPARSVVFAHRLLHSLIVEGGPVGLTVAECRFRYADGADETVEVRDRFEIGAIPALWGQLPFRAVPDARDHIPLDRTFGRFDQGGGSLTEVNQAEAQDYFLWAWINPRPDQAIESIEIASKGPRMIIAAITIGDVDEHPFVHAGARPIRIEIDNDQVSDKSPIELNVDVDRGVSAVTYSLARQSTESFLADDALAGFGEPFNAHSSPAYAQIATVPSATVTIRQGEDVLGSAPWEDIRTGKEVQAGRARIQLVDTGRNWVRTTVLDEHTGMPIPCRVHFRSPHGVPFAPHGHHAHVGRNQNTWHLDVGGDVRLGQVTYAYINGICEGWLPRGEVIVDVARGFEYQPLRATVTIKPGQRELTLKLKRFRDMNAEGWYSGDTHVHFLSTPGATLEAQGEDLNVVNLLQSQWGNLFTSTEEFTGAPVVSRDGRTIVSVNQENRQHVLGHMILLGLKEPVMPWCSDGPSEDGLGGTLDVTLAEWADRCHAQGGTVVLPHFPNPNGEPAALIATGRLDALEFHGHGGAAETRYTHNEYYRYLNAGYRLPVAGGTDKMDAAVPVGIYRTYVRIPEDESFSYESWCRNLARGRTFLSGGPLLNLTVDGAQIGDLVHVRGGGTVQVVAEMQSIIPVETLEIIVGGKVVASSEDAWGARTLRVETTVRIDADTWIAARAGGPGYFSMRPHNDGWARGVMAHTSPVYVTTGEEYQVFHEENARHMLTLINGAMSYISEMTAQRPAGEVTHRHGEADHMAHLLRPFEEAREAVRSRLAKQR